MTNPNVAPYGLSTVDTNAIRQYLRGLQALAREVDGNDDPQMLMYVVKLFARAPAIIAGLAGLEL